MADKEPVPGTSKDGPKSKGAIPKVKPTPKQKGKKKKEEPKKENPKDRMKRTGAAYDEKGVHILSGLDICDCLNVKCPGCFYPCNDCFSQKCGVECRVNRKYDIEEIQNEDGDTYANNPCTLKSPKAK